MTLFSLIAYLNLILWISNVVGHEQLNILEVKFAVLVQIAYFVKCSSLIEVYVSANKVDYVFKVNSAIMI